MSWSYSSQTRVLTINEHKIGNVSLWEIGKIIENFKY